MLPRQLCVLEHYVELFGIFSKARYGITLCDSFATCSFVSRVELYISLCGSSSSILVTVWHCVTLMHRLPILQLRTFGWLT